MNNENNIIDKETFESYIKKIADYHSFLVVQIVRNLVEVSDYNLSELAHLISTCDISDISSNDLYNVFDIILHIPKKMTDNLITGDNDKLVDKYVDAMLQEAKGAFIDAYILISSKSDLPEGLKPDFTTKAKKELFQRALVDHPGIKYLWPFNWTDLFLSILSTTVSCGRCDMKTLIVELESVVRNNEAWLPVTLPLRDAVMLMIVFIDHCYDNCPEISTSIGKITFSGDSDYLCSKKSLFFAILIHIDEVEKENQEKGIFTNRFHFSQRTVSGTDSLPTISREPTSPISNTPFDGDVLNIAFITEMDKDTYISDALVAAQGNKEVAIGYLKSQIDTKKEEIIMLVDAISDLAARKEQITQ